LAIKKHIAPVNFLHLGLHKEQMDVPLGWVLSDAVQTQMDEQIISDCEVFQN